MPVRISDPNASPRQIAFIERLVEERVMTDEQVSWTLDKVRAHKSGDRLIPKVLASRIIGQRDAEGGRYINGLLSLPVKEGYGKDRFQAFPTGRSVIATREEHRHYSDGDSIAVIEVPENFTEVDSVPEIVVPRRNQVPAKIGIYRRDDGNVYVVRKRRGSDRRYSLRLVASPPRLAANGETVHHDFSPDYRMLWVLTDGERLTDDDEIRALSIKVGACVMCNHAIWQAKSVRRMMGTRCYKRVHGLI
jgi:hypothetical protein